jgi:hypothetical protein
MLIGPDCASAAGAATVAAAPAAAAVRKRRREVCLSLLDLLIGLSPFSGRAHALAVNYCRQDKGLRVALATRLRDNATLRRSPDAPDINHRRPDLFLTGRNKFPSALSRCALPGLRLQIDMPPSAVNTPPVEKLL